jgi:N-acylneuraminate cytidylyltransferase/CMP-N,N'-diacetyllegionaminic acid synthase
MRPYAVASFGQMPRRQDTEPLFSLDGSLYASTVEALRRERGFCHARTLSYATPRHKSFEVDDLVDFICIEAILAQRDLCQDLENPSVHLFVPTIAKEPT